MVADNPDAKTIWPDSDICNRLGQSLEEWRKITSNKTVLSWIEFGLTYEWTDGAPPPSVGTEYRIAEELNEARDKELTRFKNLGAIVRLPEEDLSTAVFNGVFVVQQRNKNRPVIDQRFPNSYQSKIHFKMDSIRDVKDLIRAKEFMFKIDIKDAYLHLRYRRAHWKFGAFWWKGEAWCCKSMMFGHTHAPRWWTKVMRSVVEFIRRKGIRCVIYLDDLLVLCGTDWDTAIRIRDFVLDTLLRLGLTINLTKSVLQPVRRISYLGFVLNSKTMTISVEAKKLTEVRKKVRKLLKKQKASARDLARILGLVSSMANAILPWRLRTRATLLSKNAMLKSGMDWDTDFVLSSSVSSELEFWLTQIQNWNGRSIKEAEPTWTTISDSSATGFGGRSELTLVAHSWDQDLKGRHSTRLETCGAVRVIKEVILREDLRDGTLLHLSDNTTAVSYLSKQGGRIPAISEEVEQLWEFCLQRGIILKARYLPGKDLPEIDFLSRMAKNDSELGLTHNDFDMLILQFGTPEIDLFATRFNTKIRRFVSFHPDPKAWAQDAFSLQWRDLGLSYAFPPFNQIGRVLSKLREEGGKMILVTPDWTGATWAPDLREMSVQYPFRLSNELMDWEGKTRTIRWHLVAWFLASKLV